MSGWLKRLLYVGIFFGKAYNMLSWCTIEMIVSKPLSMQRAIGSSKVLVRAYRKDVQ